VREADLIAQLEALTASAPTIGATERLLPTRDGDGARRPRDAETFDEGRGTHADEYADEVERALATYARAERTRRATASALATACSRGVSVGRGPRGERGIAGRVDWRTLPASG
jgi:hypothetical protein